MGRRREGLSTSAAQTLLIVDTGEYEAPSGQRVTISSDVVLAVDRTALFHPLDTDQLLGRLRAVATGEGCLPAVEIVAESTVAAAHRCATDGKDILVLNFASARRPGGGFLGGARAQEEDLARASALFRCLETQPAYYTANRQCASFAYTDHIIYSPQVPFFRDEKGDLLEKKFLASILTAPAPNAGEIRAREPDAEEIIRQTFVRRTAKLLAVAVDQGHRTLVLGAWGCGVFGNDPYFVAEVFKAALAEPAFSGLFDRVVFAILARHRADENLTAFKQVFDRAE